jgi:hypothetical protein
MVSRDAVITRRITRTPEEPLKHHISNSLCFLITFGASKASHGYFMSDEVGWHLSSIKKIKHELCKVNRGTVDCLERGDNNHNMSARAVEWDASYEQFVCVMILGNKSLADIMSREETFGALTCR